MVMPDEKEEIEQRMDKLAREYGRTRSGDPCREEIAKELHELCERLDRLVN
jgi:predicted DNA-binding protein